MMWGYHDGQGWWMIFGFLTMAVFWVGLIAALYYLFSGGDRRDRNDPTPRDIAARRYANGEIDEEEFDRIIDRIDGRGGSSVA